MAEPEMTTPSEADQLAFFDTVATGFDRATAGSEVVVWDFRVAGRTLRLRFAGPALVPAIVPALAHLERPAENPPELTIDLFDAESTGTPLPFTAARLVDLLRLRWWEHLQGRREIKGLNGQRIRSVFHLGPDILVLWDRAQRRGLYWIERADSIPYYEKGYPLSVLLNWWLASLGCQVVHAACIGGPHAAVLLTGRGGSGKSTTTLNCILAGLRIAGDDYAAIDAATGTAHSLYNTIKLKTLADVARFPGLASRVCNLDRVGDGPDQEKAMVFLHEHLPQGLAASMPIRAILVPRIVDRPDTTIVPAPAVAAFKALAPSTVFQLPGNAHEAFRALAQLTRQLPTYEIQLGRDFSSIPGVLEDFLSQWQSHR
jgi:hypothetical protein